MGRRVIRWVKPWVLLFLSVFRAKGNILLRSGSNLTLVRRLLLLLVTVVRVNFILRVVLFILTLFILVLLILRLLRRGMVIVKNIIVRLSLRVIRLRLIIGVVMVLRRQLRRTLRTLMTLISSETTLTVLFLVLFSGLFLFRLLLKLLTKWSNLFRVVCRWRRLLSSLRVWVPINVAFSFIILISVTFQSGITPRAFR